MIEDAQFRGASILQKTEIAAHAARWRAVIAFAILFAVYQAAEGLQTVIRPGSALGPALMLLAALLPWPLGRWLGYRGYDAFGLDLKASSLRLVASLILLAALAFLASRGIGAALGYYAAPSSLQLDGLVLAGAAAALTTLVPSIAEDIITRGFLLKTFRIPLGLVSYSLLSALLYTLNHVWRFEWGVSEQIRLFALGLAYGAAAWRWRTLWGAVGLHWGWNLSNAWLGQLLPTEAVHTDGARYISAVAHLAILAIVLLLPRVRSTWSLGDDTKAHPKF
jgi:membrane protease YdiL (CAAX protease family)